MGSASVCFDAMRTGVYEPDRYAPPYADEYPVFGWGELLDDECSMETRRLERRVEELDMKLGNAHGLICDLRDQIHCCSRRESCTIPRIADCRWLREELEEAGAI